MLTEKAEKIFKLKYAQPEEDWARGCWRVASYVASAEETQENKDKYEKIFFELIYNLVFLPGGRVLANAGTGIKNLLNCFVLPVEDSRESIYKTLKDAAEVFAHGGGVGYNFSNVREEGADIISTGGKASGPLSFMTLFDQTGEVIQQASRRGAQLGCLDVNHPDIMKFIHYKSTPNTKNKRLLEEYKRNLESNGLDKKGTKYFKVLEKTLQDDQLSHFNISVMVNDDFMSSVLEDKEYELISRQNDLVVDVLKAKDILYSMAEMSWESGDPGILFYDRTNEDNMVPYLGNLKSTNPCGEVPLLSYEPCCLGSINLLSFYDEKTNNINWEFLEFAVRSSVRFLDNVQTITELPIEEINKWSKGLRRLGLGVMGWADLLAELEIPYDSLDATYLAKYISWFISFFGWLESIELAKEKGVFPFYEKDKVNLHVIEKTLNSEFNPYKFDMNVIREFGVRNVAITSIAPTGSIALIAGVNSGIEPFFSLSYKRNLTNGIGNTATDFVIEVNPILKKKLIKYSLEEFEEKFLSGNLDSADEIFERVKRGLRTSHEVSPYHHVDMQAAWQTYVDNSISKTINLPENSTVEDIYDILIYMWNSGLKGGTIYRNKSKTFQILES